MTIIVTGGAGFVGSHLVDRLVEEHQDVLVVDDLSTGNVTNLEEARRSGRVRFLDADIIDPATPRYVMEQAPDAEALYHLASRASPPAYQAAPIETLRSGSEGTRNMLEVARRSDIPLLLASTSEVYGDPAVSPQPESYRGNVDCVGPRSMYDEAKRFAESLTMSYHRTYGTPIRIARIFNTYGPRLAPGDGRVVSNFIRQALNGEPLTVYGDGSQTRSFCYVSDLVRGLQTLMERGDERPTNLGNPEEITIMQLAENIQDLVDRSLTIRHEPLPGDDPQRRRPDITRAVQMLDWRPEVGLKDGLIRTMEAMAQVTVPHVRRRGRDVMGGARA